MASKQAKFTGYVKPIIHDLDILGNEDRDDNVLRKLWESIAGGIGQVFKNQNKDQVATKIPFEGRLDNPQTDLWITVINILQNAFIQAIQPSIDNEINIASVEPKKDEKKTLFEKVFGSKDDKDDKKESRKEKRKERKEEKEKEKKKDEKENK